jgi:sec-independent protein translocase protein TatA
MSPIFAFLSGPEIAVIVGLAVLLFGAKKIPELARSMGLAKKEFEAAQAGQPAPSSAPEPTAPPQAPPQPPAAPQP